MELFISRSFYMGYEKKLKNTKVGFGDIDQKPEVKIKNLKNGNQSFPLISRTQKL